jgi:hypothetical protein
MTLQWALVIAIFLLCGNSTYTTRVIARGSDGLAAVLGASTLRNTLGAGTTAALIATIVWGLWHLKWYLVPLVFLFGVSLPAVFYSKNAIAFWYDLQPFIDVLAIVGATCLWIFG